jgi:hypothetical protein
MSAITTSPAVQRSPARALGDIAVITRRNQPVTVAGGALRGLVLGQGVLPPGRTVAGQVALALLWAAAITAVFAPLAVRRYRRTLR